MDVKKGLHGDIRKYQTKLRIAIKNHQVLVLKSKAEPENMLIKYEIKSAQEDIWTIGVHQRRLINLLRKELNIHEKEVKQNIKKEGLEERRSNLINLINKSRKQTLTNRSASVSSLSNSDDSLLDTPSAPTSPNPPLLPHELSQAEFLGRMGLCTHDIFKELQNKRVERKRRSTANPQFLYGNRWDHTTKRKKNAYLMSMSPPNTRQALKNRLREQQQQLQLQQQQQQQQQRTSPPLSQSSQKSDSRSCSPISNSASTKKSSTTSVPPGLNIPNLPSGLTIERINGNKQASADNRSCVVCRGTGSLSVCETCNSYYHLRCHNRPLVQQPRQCPKCLGRKESPGGGTRDVGSLSVPPSMTVLTTYVSAEVKEKAQEKRILIEKNESLRTELTQLEGRAEQLKISLRDQRDAQSDMLSKQRQTEQNIRRLLDFLNIMKGQPAPASPTPPPSAPPQDTQDNTQDDDNTQDSEEAATQILPPSSSSPSSPIRLFSPTNSDDEPEFEIVETDVEPVTLTPICAAQAQTQVQAQAQAVSVSEGS